MQRAPAHDLARAVRIACRSGTLLCAWATVVLAGWTTQNDSLTAPSRISTPARPVVAVLMLVLGLVVARACRQGKPVGTRHLPFRRRGTDIALEARIAAVADVYDALTSDRPYRGALPSDAAERYIVDAAGSHFDPAVVDAFVRVLQKNAMSRA